MSICYIHTIATRQYWRLIGCRNSALWERYGFKSMFISVLQSYPGLPMVADATITKGGRRYNCSAKTIMHNLLFKPLTLCN